MLWLDQRKTNRFIGGKRVYIRFTELEYELVAGYAKDAGYPIGTFCTQTGSPRKAESQL